MAFPVKLMLTCVFDTLVTTAVNPAGILVGVTLLAVIKLSPLVPVKVVPVKVAVIVVEILPLLAVLSVKVLLL